MLSIEKGHNMTETISTAVEQAPNGPPKISSSDLFRGGRIVVITHDGETYRLLLTRNNRLILQK